MAVFTYKALSRTGQEVFGTLARSSEWEVKRELRARGLFVAEVRAARRWSRAGLQELLGRPGRCSDRQLIRMTRHLVQFRRASIPVGDCFDIMAREEGDRRWRRTLLDIGDGLRSGLSLMQSLSAQQNTFPEIYVKAIGAAEEAGRLEEVLSDLAKSLEERLSLKRRLLDALTYPAFVACVSVAVVAFLLGYVVPRVTGILEESGELLPAPTRALLYVSSVFCAHWPLMGLGVIIAVAALRIVRRFESAGRLMDEFKLRLPGVCRLLWKTELAAFGSSLSILLKSGVPLVEAMGVAQGVIRNRGILDALRHARRAVDSGGALAASVRGAGGFPLSMLSIMAAGEESGELAEVLADLSAAFREDVELAYRRLGRFVEPMAIIILGALVGFIAFAVLLPILQLSEAML